MQERLAGLEKEVEEAKTLLLEEDKTAKEFRKARHTLLRENQWQDLMVRIMA